MKNHTVIFIITGLLLIFGIVATTFTLLLQEPSNETETPIEKIPEISKDKIKPKISPAAKPEKLSSTPEATPQEKTTGTLVQPPIEKLKTSKQKPIKETVKSKPLPEKANASESGKFKYFQEILVKDEKGNPLANVSIIHFKFNKFNNNPSIVSVTESFSSSVVETTGKRIAEKDKSLISNSLKNTLKTDSLGKAKLGFRKKPGKFIIHLTKKGFLEVNSKHNKLTLVPLEIILRKGGSISGTVIDVKTGKEIAADIAFSKKGKWGWRQFKKIKTDSAGKFEYSGLPFQKIKVVATANGFIPSDKKIINIIREKTAKIKFKLKQGQVFTGTIIDSNTGKPIKNVKVNVGIWKKWNSYRFTVKSNSEGHVAISGIKENQNHVSLKIKGFSIKILKITEFWNTDGGKLELEPEGKLILYVKPGDNKIITGISFNFSNDNSISYSQNMSDKEMISYIKHNDLNHSSKSLGNNKWSKDLPAGKHSFTISHKEYLKSDAIKIDVKIGQTTEVDISLVNAKKILIRMNIADINLPLKGTLKLSNGNGKFSSSSTISRKKNEHFSFYASNPQYTHFSLELKGFLSTKIAAIPSGKGELWVDLVLLEGATIEGNVLSHLGKPQPGVKIDMKKVDSHMGFSFSRNSYRGEPKAVTDKNGKYSLSGVFKGKIKLTLWHDEHADIEAEIIVNEFKRIQKDFQLIKGTTLSGKVTGADGKPLNNETVRLEKKSHHPDVPDFYTQLLTGEIKTDEKGHFIVKNLNPGNYRYSINTKENGNAVNKKIKIMSGHDSQSIVIQLEKGLAIEGKIVDEFGNPIPDFSFNLIAKNNRMNPYGGFRGNEKYKTDINGVFSIPGMPEGDYQLNPQGKEFYLKEDISIKAGSLDNIIKLKKNVQINGKVLAPDGSAINNFKIYVYRGMQFGGKNEVHNLKKKDSNFSFFPETYMLKHGMTKINLIAESKGYSSGKSRSINLKSYKGTVLVITLNPEITLTVKVLNQKNNSPLQGAMVYFTGKKDLKSYHANILKNKTTDSKGIIMLNSLPETNGEVTIKHSEFAEKKIVVEVLKTGTILETTLSKGGTLKGNVFNKDMSVLPNARVTAIPRNMDMQMRMMYLNSREAKLTALSNDQGEYEITLIPPGKYNVIFKDEKVKNNHDIFNQLNSKDNALKANIIEDEIFQLDLGGQGDADLADVFGKVTKGEKPVTGGQIILMKTEPKLKMSKLAMLKEDGTYHFKEIAPGKYQLFIQLMKKGGGMFKRNLELVKGEKKEFNIEMPSGGMTGTVSDENGTKIEGGAVLVFKSGSLKNKSSPIKLMISVEGQTRISNGSFSLDVNKNIKLDLYISPLNKNYTPLVIPGINSTEAEDLKLEFVLKKGRTISVHFQDAQKQAIGMVNYYIKNKDGIICFWERSPQTSSNEDGTAEIKGCPLDYFYLVAAVKGYGISIAKIGQDIPVDKKIAITLHKAVNFKIALSGSNIQERKVQLIRKSENELENYSGRPISMAEMQKMFLGGEKQETDDAGKYEFKDVTVGTYQLKVLKNETQKKDWLSPEFHVSLETIEIPISLP